MNLDAQLSASVDGDLETDDELLLQRQIASDPQIAARLEEMKQLTRLLNELPLPELDDTLVNAVLDRAEPVTRTAFTMDWRSFVAGGLLAAAAGLLLQLAPGMAPSVYGVDGQQFVDGEHTVAHGALTVQVDGRAKLSTDGFLQIHVAAGTVMVRDGEYVLAELGPDEHWQQGAAPEAAQSPAPKPAPSVSKTDASRARILRLEAELALANDRLAEHEGTPLPWPDDLPALLSPNHFEMAALASIAEAQQGELLAIECSEYPCAVLLYASHGLDDEPDWEHVLYPITDQLPERWQVVSVVRHEDRGDVRHAVAMVGVMDPEHAEQYQEQLMKRVRHLIELFQPEVMRNP